MTSQIMEFSKIETEASEWLVAMSDRTVSLEQRNQFEMWLRADPDHARIYRVQKAAWSAIARMPYLLDESAAAHEEAPLSAPALGEGELPSGKERVLNSLRVRNFALAAALVIALVGGAFLAESNGVFGRPDEFETTTAEVKDVKLDDG